MATKSRCDAGATLRQRLLQVNLTTPMESIAHRASPSEPAPSRGYLPRLVPKKWGGNLRARLRGARVLHIFRTMLTLIVGTNRPGSNTRKVARNVEDIYSGLEVPLNVLDLAELPPEIFSPASYAEKPTGFRRFADEVVNASGLIVVTPEYNGSVPGILKYFIDMLKFPESFEERPVCFVGLAAGMWGALRPVEQLQAIFGYRNAFIYPVRVFMPRVNSLLDDDGRITDTDVVERLREQAIGFIDFVEHLKGVNLRKEANEQSD